MQSPAGVKGIGESGVRGGGGTGTKCEQLPWEGKNSAPECPALGTFWRVPLSKQGPRGTRQVWTSLLSFLREEN
jgi:hypothetical protein